METGLRAERCCVVTPTDGETSVSPALVTDQRIQAQGTKPGERNLG